MKCLNKFILLFAVTIAFTSLALAQTDSTGLKKSESNIKDTIRGGSIVDTTDKNNTHERPAGIEKPKNYNQMRATKPLQPEPKQPKQTKPVKPVPPAKFPPAEKNNKSDIITPGDTLRK